jgi:uncharacterized coiled-coil DUF342 family protein
MSRSIPAFGATHNGQAEHATSEHDDSTSDTPAHVDRRAIIVRESESERVTLVAQRDQINSQIKALQARKAQITAEVERCDSLIEWATKTVKPRGKPKAPQSAPKPRR